MNEGWQTCETTCKIWGLLFTLEVNILLHNDHNASVKTEPPQTHLCPIILRPISPYVYVQVPCVSKGSLYAGYPVT